MATEIHNEDLKDIIELFRRLAANSSAGAQDFLKNLISRSNLPDAWKDELLEKGELSAAGLIRWARAKGKNKDDEQYHTLGSVLIELLEETGDQQTIAVFLLRYELCQMQALPPDLRPQIDLQEIERQKRQYAVLSKMAKDELEIILKGIANSEANFEIVKIVCRRSLPRLAQHYTLAIHQLDEVFRLLLVEFPYRNDGKRRILEFIGRLCEHHKIQSQLLHLDLEDWLKQYDFETPDISETPATQSPQPRLFIQITPRHCEADRSGRSEQFSVQAWLIPDQAWLVSDLNSLKKNYAEHEYFYLNFSYLLSSFYDDLLNYYQHSPNPRLWMKLQQLKPENLLKLDNSLKSDNSLESQVSVREVKHIRDLSFTREELPELLELFVNESLLLLYSEAETNDAIDADELTIELFLPAELLCDCDMDQWSFRNLFEDNQDGLGIGSSYRFLLRSLERSRWLQSSETVGLRMMAKNAGKKQAWQRKWRSIQHKLSEGTNADDLEFELLHQISTVDKVSLSEQLDKKIGVKLVQVTQRDEILQIIIHEKSIPIVLWTRCRDLELHLANELTHTLNDLVHQNPLHHLPQSVLATRRAAQSESENHLGRHLVLLWDDPNRCPPPEGTVLRMGSIRSKL